MSYNVLRRSSVSFLIRFWQSPPNLGDEIRARIILVNRKNERKEVLSPFRRILAQPWNSSMTYVHGWTMWVSCPKTSMSIFGRNILTWQNMAAASMKKSNWSTTHDRTFQFSDGSEPQHRFWIMHRRGLYQGLRWYQEDRLCLSHVPGITHAHG